MPEDLYYEENHYWIREEGDLIVMGMDDFAQQMAGAIVFVQLPFEGKKLTRQKKFAKVESGKWVGKVFAPLDGVVHSCNEDLEINPELINKDCYGAGWMYKIEPDDKADLQLLIHGVEAVEKWMLTDIEQFRKD